MGKARLFATAAILAAIAAILTRFWPLPSPSVASLALGTDDAFIESGFEPRENLVGGSALRWTQPRAALRFEGVGPGAVDIDLLVRDHRTELTVTANGATVGSLAPGETHFAQRVQMQGDAVVIGLETEGFATSSGRKLGTQFVSLKVTPANDGGAGVRFWGAFLGIFTVALLAQAASGLMVEAALLPPVVFAIFVLPAGLWRSEWLIRCAIGLVLSTVASAAVARLSRGPRWTHSVLGVALLLGLSVHGLLPPSPLMIQGDAQLHGNKLAEVAGGNAFPLSRTDHKPPFDFPYGFSFYGLLSPFASTGSANPATVRTAAAIFSGLSLIALATALGRISASFATVSVLLWTFLPVNVQTMPFGNLNNVFAQAIFVLFLTTSILRSPGRSRTVLLTFLAALSATAHLSSFVVLLTLLLMSIVLRDRSNPAFKPLLAGVLLASAYFATFFPLIVRQIPRLLGERGGSGGVFDPFRLPNQIVAGLGWPLIALIAFALLSGRARGVLPLSKSLTVTGALLAVAALVSPLEVRYLLALAPLVSIAAASVFFEPPLTPDGFPSQTPSSVIDFRWLRALSSDRFLLPISGLLLLASLFQGARLLKDVIPFFKG